MSLMLTEVHPADDRIRPSGKGEAPKDSTGQRATVRASPGQQPCPARRKESVGMRATRQATRGHAPRPLSVVAVLACCALTVGGSTALGQGIGATGRLAGRTHAASGVCAHAKRADRLVIERVNYSPRNHEHFTFPAKVTVNDPERARAVAQAVCALPPMPRGTYHCPADFGIIYTLNFTVDAMMLRAVTVEATGCQQVSGLGRTRWLALSPAFWSVLGIAMGIAHPDSSTFTGTMG